MNKILVTGGDGQLGQAIKAIADDRFVFTNRNELDITDTSSIDQFFAKHQFSHLINCAAYTAVDKAEEEPEKCNENNIYAVRKLAMKCNEMGCTMIHISSDYVYHPSHELPMAEEEKCQPKGVYAKSKLAGEVEIQNNLKNHVILRTSWVYGSTGHNFVRTMLRLGKSRKEVSVVADQIGSPTFASDLAAAILTITEKGGKWGTYNYSNLGFISWADFAEEVFLQSGMDVKVNRIPSSDYPTPAARPLNSRLIKSKIADEFQLNLHYWKGSLTKCLQEIDN